MIDPAALTLAIMVTAGGNAIPRGMKAGENAKRRLSGEKMTVRVVPAAVTITHFDASGKAVSKFQRPTAMKAAVPNGKVPVQERSIKFYKQRKLSRWVYSFYDETGRPVVERVIYYNARGLWVLYVHTFFQIFPCNIVKAVTIIDNKGGRPVNARFYLKNGKSVARRPCRQ